MSSRLRPRFLGSIGLAGLLLLAGSGRAWACSCAELPDVEQSARAADVVFEGRPTGAVALQADLGVGGYLGARRFSFEVARYFKGQLGPALSVFTVDESSACGRGYALEEPYVVYARYTDSGLLSDFLCSRSGPSSFADEDLAILGSGIAPDPEVVDDWSVSGDPASGASVGGSGIERDPAVRGGPAGCAASLRSERSSAGRSALGALVGLVAVGCASARRRGRA